MDDFETNQDNIVVRRTSDFHKHGLSPRTLVTKPLSVESEYDDECLAPSVIADDQTRMSPPPQLALQNLWHLLGHSQLARNSVETRDDSLMSSSDGSGSERSETIARVRSALDSLQGNERRLLVPLIHHKSYSVKRIAQSGFDALHGQDLQRLLVLQEAASSRWRVAFVRVKRIVTIDAKDELDDCESLSYTSSDDEDGYADSRLYVDKVICWTGTRPVDVRWFNLGLHSAEDGGIVLGSEEEVEHDSMWTETISVDESVLIYETSMLAFYDKALTRNKFTWLKYY